MNLSKKPKWLTLCIGIVAAAVSGWPSFGLAAVAETPIHGGLGVQFDQPVTAQQIGAQLQDPSHITGVLLPENRKMIEPQIEPGGHYPWHRFPGVVLPRPLRVYEHSAHIMLNTEGLPIRVSVTVSVNGCGEEFKWMRETLAKKYRVIGDMNATPPESYQQALRVVFVDRQIDMWCGPQTVIQYLDFSQLRQWAVTQHKVYDVYVRERSKQEKRQLVLHRRRSENFANQFTMGDQYKLDGAFGISFRQPFAKNSTQNFPIDIPFYAVLPNLPAEFQAGEIQLVISPLKHPIIIRGTFRELQFDKVKNALRAKYGTPMKSTDRHVIHKVADKHAILKRMSLDTIELAFIDTLAQTEQRARLWEEETQGL